MKINKFKNFKINEDYLSKTFTEKFESLQNEVIDTLKSLIQSNGRESEFSNKRVLVINDNELNFNLDGNRYLSEISENDLIDNKGYEYNFDVLSL